MPSGRVCSLIYIGVLLVANQEADIPWKRGMVDLGGGTIAVTGVQRL